MKQLTTLKEVTDFVAHHDKTLLVFYADWCGPCKVYKPVYERLERNFSDINVVRINVDEAEDVARSYGIRAVPYSVMVNGGTRKNQAGVVSYNFLKESFGH